MYFRASPTSIVIKIHVPITRVKDECVFRAYGLSVCAFAHVDDLVLVAKCTVCMQHLLEAVGSAASLAKLKVDKK